MCTKPNPNPNPTRLVLVFGVRRGDKGCANPNANPNPNPNPNPDQVGLQAVKNRVREIASLLVVDKVRVRVRVRVRG